MMAAANRKAVSANLKAAAARICCHAKACESSCSFLICLHKQALNLFTSPSHTSTGFTLTLELVLCHNYKL